MLAVGAVSSKSGDQGRMPWEGAVSEAVQEVRRGPQGHLWAEW